MVLDVQEEEREIERACEIIEPYMVRVEYEAIWTDWELKMYIGSPSQTDFRGLSCCLSWAVLV